MVQKLDALSSCRRWSVSAARMNEEETKIAFARPLILPGKIIRVEWLKSSSLDENIYRNFNGQNNSRTKQ